MSEPLSSSDVASLVRAMESYTAAVTQLVHAVESQSAAVMMLVGAMAEADDEVPDLGTYMDGSPIAN